MVSLLFTDDSHNTAIVARRTNHYVIATVDIDRPS